MSLIYRKKAQILSLSALIADYMGEIKPFAARVEKKWHLAPLVILKTIEWSIYRWYKSPIRRFYGVKANELIYMVTRRCSDKCQKCGIWRNPEPDAERISVDVFINCLRSLHENLYQLTLTGGEPLLFKTDVLRIAEESRKLNVPMLIVTNGSLLTKEFLDEYSRSGHILVVSLDTLNRGKWADFRGRCRRDHYDAVMNNILLANEVMPGKLRIQSVLAQETVEDIPEIMAFCQKLGVQHVVQPYMDFGGTWHDAGIASSQGSNVPCAARKNICIYPNGDVVKCFDHHRIPLAKEPLGNIAKKEIIPILCEKRSTVVSRLMKDCDFPCKRMSCNVSPPQSLA